MAAVLHLVISFVSMVTVTKANSQYLYYTGPGGAAYGELPGFYGAPAQFAKNASALNYPDSGVQCLETESGLVEGFDLLSVSMDPKSRKVLLSVKHSSEKSVTLATINLCLPQEDCGNATYSPVLLFDNAQLDHVMSPIAYYDSTVYFLATFDKDTGGLTTRTVELRMLYGCHEKYPVDVYTSFYITDCSRRIAVIASEKFDPQQTVSPLSVSNNLYIINTDSNSFFLTQIQRIKYDADGVPVKYTMELVLVKNSTDEVVSLHKEDLDPKFRSYELYHIGAIHHHKDKLCWSAVDTILCADWSNSGSISNPHTVLAKGESSKACLNMPGSDIAPLLVTGIAVAKTDGQYAIYFGCIAQTAGYGGAGLIRKVKQETAIFSLQVNKTAVYAGSMFMISACQPEKENPGFGMVSVASNLPNSFFTFLVLFLLIRL